MRVKKIGGGTMRIGDRRIQPGEVFDADIKDIPASFRDLIQVVDPQDKIDRPPVSQYKVEKRSIGWYNVIDRYGKVINDVALRKTEAEELIKTL